MKILLAIGIFLCFVSKSFAAEMFDRTKHSDDYYNYASIFMMNAPEEYTEENVAEIVLAHREMDQETRNIGDDDPILVEAREVIKRIHGSIGKRKVLPNGWSLSGRDYEK